MKSVRINGYEMAYVERGSGDPVIFVHGAGVDYRYWIAQMEPFAAKYRTIAVSLRRYYPERASRYWSLVLLLLEIKAQLPHRPWG